MQYHIYKVTNKVNKKVYIGKTNDFEKRKKEHTIYDINDNSIFHKALLKYGLDNFKWEIVCSTNCKEELNELEKFFIKKYNSFKPNGYNMTKGGDGGSMWNAKPVVCLEKNGQFVARYDSAGEAEKKAGYTNSSVLTCCKTKNRTHKGKIFMFEDEYISDGAYIYQKPKSTICKKIIQCDLFGNKIKSFESVTQASKETGIKRSNISQNLTKKCKTSHGYIFVYEDDYPIENLFIHKHNKKGKKIYQLNAKTGEVINSFNSIKEAGECLNVNYKSIHKVVDNPKRKAYGYKWISQYANTEVKHEVKSVAHRNA